MNNKTLNKNLHSAKKSKKDDFYTQLVENGTITYPTLKVWALHLYRST